MSARAEDYLAQWRDFFDDYYPEAAGKPPVAGLRASLTRLDPSEYRELVYEWPLEDLLIWAEESRVQHSFDELEDTDGPHRRGHIGA